MAHPRCGEPESALFLSGLPGCGEGFFAAARDSSPQQAWTLHFFRGSLRCGVDQLVCDCESLSSSWPRWATAILRKIAPFSKWILLLSQFLPKFVHSALEFLHKEFGGLYLKNASNWHENHKNCMQIMLVSWWDVHSSVSLAVSMFFRECKKSISMVLFWAWVCL